MGHLSLLSPYIYMIKTELVNLAVTHWEVLGFESRAAE
jgi:hypothetical protein